MKPVAVAAVLLAFACGSAHAFDTNAYCQEVSEAVGGSYQIEQTCRDQERKAKRSIEIGTAPARIIDYCREIGDAVGGSYQIMKTCIDQELKAKANLN